MDQNTRKPNHLAGEKSPYLLQHAYNPVNWYPWCDEAFEKAVQQDIPVFLSIGYSTCHWCHVMAHESFEDQEVAEILNRGFVSIKVDREERNDIDAVYMSACQALTGSGGWPLTIVMTPDKKPFFAGTYFPKREKFGSLGLIEILTFLEKGWKDRRQDLLDESRRITGFLQQEQQLRGGKTESPQELISSGISYFSKAFDHKWGGFGPAPKFPSPHNLLFLLEQEEENCTAMAEKTLIQMYRGGIFDHIGGGFCRYSTDAQWLVPHFEKMLYDNALLLLAYSSAFSRTGNDLYKEIADRITQYVFRELTDEQGAFYCSQDADSEGEEGKFYVFAPGEIKQVLGESEGDAFCRRFDITGSGNFEGRSIPNLLKTGDYRKQEKQSQLEKLMEYRLSRTELHKDDKILTGWNGMMIAALAKSSVQLCRPDFLEAAFAAEAFVWKNLHGVDGKLLTRWRKGEAAFPAVLEDYAFFAWAQLECYSASFDEAYLEKAILLGEQILEQFFDWEQGGCFLYGKNSEELFLRPKELYDGAIPSGNSAAAFVMKKLAFFTGHEKWRRAWDLQKEFLLKNIRQPAGHSFFLWILTQEQRQQGQLICTARAAADVEKLAALDMDVLLKTEENKERLETAAPFLKEYPVPEKGAVYYFCRGNHCSSPVTSLDEVEKISKK